MKKFIAITSALVALVCAFSICATLVGAEPTATAAWGTPEAIDGVLDAGWANANTYAADQVNGVTEVTMDWKIMYDDTYLYVYADVTDSTIGTVEEETPWAADSLWAKNTVQLYIDLGNERCVGYYDNNDIEIEVNAQGHYYAKYFQASRFVEKAAVLTETGYAVEIALDLGVYSGFENAAGTEIGFDIWAADSNENYNGRAGFVSWTGLEKVYYDPSSMGTVTLGEKPDNTPGYNGLIVGDKLQDLGAVVTPISNASGSHMSNMALMVDGNRTNGLDTWRCSYTDDLGVWFGAQFEKEYEVSQVVFWEGGHWANGGWFGTSPRVQCYVDGAWVDVDFTLAPVYPGDSMAEQGWGYEPYFFNLESPVACSKIRVIGNLPACDDPQTSISEFEVYGDVYEDAVIPTNPTAVYGAPIAIDGSMDAGWEDAYLYAADQVAGNATNSMNYKVMYDGTYLYIFAEVTDSTVWGADEENAGIKDDGLWIRNTVHVYLDLGYDRTTSYDANDIEIDINSSGRYFCKNIRAKNFVDVATVITEDGYNVEMRLDLGVYPEFNNESGTKIGYDIWAADCVDLAAGRAGFVSVTGFEATYYNTSLMATLELAQKPEDAEGYNGLVKGNYLQSLGATLTPIFNTTGGNIRDVERVVDGNKQTTVSANLDTWGSTFTDDLGIWAGIEFETQYDITQVIFWEGGHWGDGGWFGSAPRLQCFVDGEWVDVAYTISRAYPGDSWGEQGWDFENYVFTLERPVTCSKVRLIGDPTNLDGKHISISEIEVYGYAAGDAPEFVPETGDVNHDGVVANSDITYVVRYLAGFTAGVDTTFFDVNDDGKINNRDAIEIVLIVADKNVI